MVCWCFPPKLWLFLFLSLSISFSIPLYFSYSLSISLSTSIFCSMQTLIYILKVTWGHFYIAWFLMIFRFFIKLQPWLILTFTYVLMDNFLSLFKIFLSGHNGVFLIAISNFVTIFEVSVKNFYYSKIINSLKRITLKFELSLHPTKQYLRKYFS